MQNGNRAPNRAYQPAVYAAQQRLSHAGDAVQKRKRQYIFMSMSGVGKDEDADLGLCQNGSGANKRLSGIIGFGKRTGLLNNPLQL